MINIKKCFYIFCALIFFISNSSADDGVIPENINPASDIKFDTDANGNITGITIQDNISFPLTVPSESYIIDGTAYTESFPKTYGNRTDLKYRHIDGIEDQYYPGDNFACPVQWANVLGINGKPWKYILGGYDQVPYSYDNDTLLTVGVHGWGDTETDTVVIGNSSEVNQAVKPYVSMIQLDPSGDPGNGKIFCSPEIQNISLNGEIEQLISGPDKLLFLLPPDGKKIPVEKTFIIPEQSSIMQDGWINSLSYYYDNTSHASDLTDLTYNHHDDQENTIEPIGGMGGIDVTLERGRFADPNRIDYDIINTLDSIMQENDWVPLWEDDLKGSCQRIFLNYLNTIITNCFPNIYNDPSYQTTSYMLPALYDIYLKDNDTQFMANFSYFYRLPAPWQETETQYIYDPDNGGSIPVEVTITKATKNVHDFELIFSLDDIFYDRPVTGSHFNSPEMAAVSLNAVPVLHSNPQPVSLSGIADNLGSTPLEKFTNTGQSLLEGEYVERFTEDDFILINFGWVPLLPIEAPVSFAINSAGISCDSETVSDNCIFGDTGLNSFLAAKDPSLIAAFNEEPTISAVNNYMITSLTYTILRYSNNIFDKGYQYFEIQAEAVNALATILGREDNHLYPVSSVTNKQNFGVGNNTFERQLTQSDSPVTYWDANLKRMPNIEADSFIVPFGNTTAHISHTGKIKKLVSGQIVLDFSGFDYNSSTGTFCVYSWADNADGVIDDTELTKLYQCWIYNTDGVLSMLVNPFLDLNGPPVLVDGFWSFYLEDDSLNTLIINDDSDNDGLFDNDELFLYGTNPSKIDTDNDSRTDISEIKAGTDPNDSESYFAVTSQVIEPDNSGLTLTWQGSTGESKQYEIYWRDTLTAQPAWNKVDNPQITQSQPGTFSWTDNGTDPEMSGQAPAQTSSRIYKVTVQ